MSEIGLSPSGVPEIHSEGVEIEFVNFNTIIGSRIGRGRWERLNEFCQGSTRTKTRGRARKPRRTHLKHHASNLILAQEASLIYQNAFLIQDEKDAEYQVYLEPSLNGYHPDCIIVGRLGIVIVEVKASDQAKQQLEDYKEFIQEEFPNVDCVIAKASYQIKGKRDRKKNKVTLTKLESE